MRRPRTLLALPLATLAALGVGRSAAADQLLTIDNRVIEVQRAREEGDAYRLVFRSGEILCPKELVKSVVIEGDMSDYVPQDDRERELLEKGFVRYRDRWMSKAGYLSEIKKKAQATRKRTAELAEHADFSNPWEKETKHFRILTNTSPELLDYYGALLESYYSLMDKRIGIKPTPSLRRTLMTVNVYKSHEDFLAANPDTKSSVLGYFWRVNNSLNFFHDYQEPVRSDWVALHECTHLLTYLIDQDYLPQIWLNEAVADYFGSAEIEPGKRGKLTITPGKLQTDRVLTVQEAIGRKKDIHLEQLVRIDRDNFGGFEYAHAWSLVYFLNSKEDYRKGFTRFFKDIYTLKIKGAEKLNAGFQDKTGIRYRYPPEVIRDHLLKRLKVKDIDELDAEWKAFIAAIPVDAPAALFKRGYRVARWRNGNAKKAMEDIERAIEAGIQDPRAWWSRGWLEIFQEEADWQKAIRDFQEASKRDPLNAVYRSDWAYALSGFRIGRDKAVGSDAELKEALVQFGLACELDDDNDLYRQLYEEYAKLRGVETQ